jgi:hypothetical protein
MHSKLYFKPLLVLSPTSRHAFKVVFYSAVLNVVGDNTNNGTNTEDMATIVNLIEREINGLFYKP